MKNGNNIEVLYNISLSIGKSLDLNEMLRSSLGSFSKELDLFGSAVFFFRVDPGSNLFLEKIASVPDSSVHETQYQNAIDTLLPFPNEKDIRIFESSLPRAGKSSGEIFYHLFSLSYIGVLVLLTKDTSLDGDIAAILQPLVDKLEIACTACIRKRELELEKKVTKSVIHDLSAYDDVLLNTIMEIRKAKDDLDESRNHLALILQSLGEGIVVADKNGKISLMNVKALEYLDYMPDSSIEFTIDRVFKNCEGSIPDLQPDIDTTEGDVPFTEVTIKSSHGRERYLRIIPHRLQGLLVGSSEVIYLIQDVSREREIDKIKNDFISNLSHELRTPMNAILGISKMLIRKGSDNLNGTQREGLSIINDSGKRLLALINDILDLSKIEAGKMELRESLFHLADMIKHIRGVADSLNTKDMIFNIITGDTVPAELFADENRLQQVLVTLIGNSIKFADQGSVTLEITASKEKIHFSIRDTGTGISPEEIPHLFERFKQVDGSSSRRYQGTGIGLSLSREIVYLMGGDITVESEPGKGTTMRFFIPLRTANYSRQVDSSYSVIDNMNAASNDERFEKRKRILVADDEESERKIFSYLLSDRYDLLFAKNGKEACEMIVSLRPDLVLMDITMPEMDGIQALERLRSDEQTRHIPVIAVTARAMKGEREKIIGYGFNSYVSKPIDEDLLMREIHDLGN